MNKSKLQIGKKYLHIRKTIIDGIEREAERWIKCVGITSEGAYFTRMMEVNEKQQTMFYLTKNGIDALSNAIGVYIYDEEG